MLAQQASNSQRDLVQRPSTPVRLARQKLREERKLAEEVGTTPKKLLPAEAAKIKVRHRPQATEAQCRRPTLLDDLS